MASTSANNLRLYGATSTDLTAALWIAEGNSIPTGNVTGEIDIATAWLNDNYAVITVGSTALDKVLAADSSYVDYCSYQTWSSSSPGPINGCGQTALDSWELSRAQVLGALNGTPPSDYTSVSPCSSCQ